MEGIALTGASVDREKGLLSTIVLEMGGSSDLCALLKPGEPVILMGPTGTPTETPAQETALLVGGGLGNAVLFSIGQQLRANGSRTIYFAGYKKIVDRYKVDEIEKAADVVVWCCDEAPGFTPGRVQDKAFVGNIVEAIEAYGRGDLGEAEIPLHSVDRVMAIGSDGMMAAVARARHTVLAPYLKPDHIGIGSINSPMQCMMKEICAQCLQVHKDPVTGEETVVFTCFNQDQPLDQVDWANLRTRLSQNGVQEKLTKQWIDRCLRQMGAREAVSNSRSGGPHDPRRCTNSHREPGAEQSADGCRQVYWRPQPVAPPQTFDSFSAGAGIHHGCPKCGPQKHGEANANQHEESRVKRASGSGRGCPQILGDHRGGERNQRD